MSKRECGSCSLCCKVLEVQAVFKAAGEWCRHFRAGTGCEVHKLRPKSCRDFSCLWLQEDWLGDEWKPSVAKFVMAWEYDGQVLAVMVDPKVPNAWRAEPYHTALKMLAERHMSENRLVMVVEPKRRILVLPDQEIVVGGRNDIFAWEVTRKGDGSNRFHVEFEAITDGGKGGGMRFDDQPAPMQ